MARDELLNAFAFAEANGQLSASFLHKLAKAYRQIGDATKALEVCRQALSCATRWVIERPRVLSTDPSTPFETEVAKHIESGVPSQGVTAADSPADEAGLFVFGFESYYDVRSPLPILHTFAVLLHESGFVTEALDTLAIVAEVFGAHNELRQYADTLGDLAILYHRSRESERAVECAAEAARLHMILGSDDLAVSANTGAIAKDNLELLAGVDALHALPGRVTVAPASARTIEPSRHRGVSQNLLVSLNAGRLPPNPAEARALLETAIIQQYRAIADGLLADMLISGEEVDHMTWWQHYSNSKANGRATWIDLESPAFKSFQRSFARDVALRRIRRIKRSELYGQEVATYGGTVYWWEEGWINRQLAALGSSLRLLVVDTDRLRFHRLRVLAFQHSARTAELGSPPPADGRFILGETGPFSAYRTASFFDFRREYAAAPRMLPAVSGFADNFRAVARRFHVSQKSSASYEQDEGAKHSPDAEDTSTYLRSIITLIHEYHHIRNRLGFYEPGQALSSWRDVVREDLCRFAARPRHIEEFAKNFFAPYSDRDFSSDSSGIARAMAIKQLPELTHDIEDLVARGLLVELSDRRYACSSYRGFSQG